ncbi:MAG: M56 family metallopeptidase [Acidobacteriota bacterium]|nr:M56 family metallopeptidase [Acidobacteriota bacterium]
MIELFVRHLLESTLFCILLGALASCLRRQGAAARHTIWLIGISKFSIPTALLAVTGARMAFVWPAASWVSSIADKVSAVLVGLFEVWPSHIGAGDITVTSFVFLAIWVLGSATMFGAWLHSLRKSYHRLALPAHKECEAFDRAKGRFGFRPAVRLRSSDEAKEPAIKGIFRPVITIPRGLSKALTATELEAVLLHELAHARRRDNLAGAFVHCLVCIFWFHPLLWFVEKRLIAERERACDEAVIHCGTNPQIYLAGLAKVCRFHLLGNVAGVSAVSGSDLKTRFDQILSGRSSQSITYAFRITLAGFVLFITLLPIAGGYCEQCVSNGQGASASKLSLS